MKTQFQILSKSCPLFAETILEQSHGRLDKEYKYLWKSFFVNSNNDDLVKDFIELNPNHKQREIDYLERTIKKIKEKNCAPTLCATFGCDEKECEKCFEGITTKSGEIPKTPAYFINDKAVKDFEQSEKFAELKDQVLEKLANGDKSAHLETAFVQSVAELKVRESKAFEELRNELKDNGAKVTAFDEAVEKEAATIAAKNHESATSVENLPEHLQPYAQNLDSDVSYVSEEGSIFVMVPTKQDLVPMQASDFVARFREIREYDDGIDKKHQFVVEGFKEGDKPLPELVLNSKEFRSMSWVLEKWGNVLITSAPKAAAVVRETIQRTSKDSPAVKVFYSIGWQEIKNKFYYLYSGGAIGNKKAKVAEIQELPGFFFKKDYPYPVEECVEYVQKFMDCAPHEITIPLLAFAFLSVLNTKLLQDGIEPKFLLWMFGGSGTFKTSLTMVLQSFFGTFSSPPCTFNDTNAALEKKGYLAKDTLLLVDDLYPSPSESEAKTKRGVAHNLIRRYGDRVSRGRSKSNLTLAKNYLPRGNVICTSEDVLTGFSTAARNLGIVVNMGDINSEKLTELQKNKDYLACFMVHYIKYVGKNIMNNPDFSFKKRFEDYRDKASDTNKHRRFAECIAHLMIGWRTLLDFLLHINHIDKATRKDLNKEGFMIFQDIAKNQNTLVKNEDPSDKWMEALNELINSKQITPKDKKTATPAHLEHGNTSSVCYFDDDYFYFIPGATHNKVVEYFRTRNDPFNYTEYILRKMLADKKYTVSSDGRNTNKVRIGDDTMNVLQISKNILKNF